MPTAEWLASAPVISARTASNPTNSARPKKENAMKRRAVFSLAWGSLAENCQATAAAEVTSMTESRPKAISALEEATVPAAMATIASTML